jgi:hypothetical protein
VISYFTTFAATGNPNVLYPSSSAQVTLANTPDAPEHISPVWPAHNSGKRIVFRAEGGGTGPTKGTKGGSYIEELEEGEVERCKVWDSLANTIQL